MPNSDFRYGRQNAVTSLMKKAGVLGLTGVLAFSGTPAFANQTELAEEVDIAAAVDASTDTDIDATLDVVGGFDILNGEGGGVDSELSLDESSEDSSTPASIAEIELAASNFTELEGNDLESEWSGEDAGISYKLSKDSEDSYSLNLSAVSNRTTVVGDNSGASITPGWVSAVVDHVGSGATVHVSVQNGPTQLGNNAFTGWPAGVSVELTLPSSVKTIANTDPCDFYDAITKVSGESSLIVDGSYLLSKTSSAKIIRCTLLEGDISLPSSMLTISSAGVAIDRAFHGSKYGKLTIADKGLIKASAFTALSDPSAEPIFDSIEVTKSGKTVKCSVREGCLYDSNGNLLLKSKDAQDSSEFEDAYHVKYSADHSVLIKAPADLSGDYTIDPLCKSIEVAAFKDCTGLTGVTGRAVETINANAFAGCSQLSSANFPLVKSVGSSTFDGCSSLESISMESCEQIGSRAFYGCSKLSSARFPNAVTVGDSAFQLSGIRSVEFGSLLSSMGVRCFGGASLAAIDLSSSKLSNIPEYCFQGCKDLKTIVFPSSLSKIGKCAFKDCSSLVSADVGDTQLSMLGTSCFSGCSKLSSIVFPDTFVLGDDAEENSRELFEGCESLALADLSRCSLVTIVPSGMFKGCSSLSSIKLPSSVQTLGDGSFMNCVSLTSFIVPENVTKIEAGSFHGCKSLASLTVPSTVNYIGAAALSGTALTEFTPPSRLWLNEDSTSIELNRFSKDSASVAGTAAMFTITASETMGKDEWDTEWSPISKVDLSNYSAWFIPAYMFMGLNKMTDITIPKSVREVDSGAFFGCMSLKKVFCNNPNVDIAGASTYGDPTLGWSVDTPPAFAAWQKQADGSYVLSNLSGIKFYGLAYGNNNLISYCEKNDCTFVPFVVLGDYDTNDKFGFQVTGYNNLKIADMVYTGQALSPEIRVSFTDRDGIADRILTDQDADIVYKDAGGNTLRTIVAPGTYTAEITGHEDEGVYGTQTVTFRVVDPNQQSGGQQSGSQQPAGQQPIQQVNQQTAMPQTGDNAASAAVPATTAAIGALGALSIALAALRRKFGKDSE